MAVELDAVIGVASPTEIGEWVEQTAAEELRDRAALIADIERSASEAVELPAIASTPGELAKGPREVPSAWHQTTKREGPPLLLRDVSQVSSLSIARGSEPPARPSRKLLSALIASGAAVLLFAGLLVVLQTRRASSELRLPATTSATLPRPEEAVPVGGPPAEADPTAAGDPSHIHPPHPAVTNVEDLPRASAGGRGVAIPPPVSLDVDPAPVHAPPIHASWPGLGAAHPAPPPSPEGGAPAVTAPAANPELDCNPPYTADAKGHIHFKPMCF
jgi:hypothetical protein